MSKQREIGLAFLIDFIVSATFYLLQLSGWVLIDTQVPLWLFTLSIMGILTMLYLLLILRAKIDPILELRDNLGICIEDFGKFFSHPHWAIMPNPFAKEPDFWKYYVDSFSVLSKWYSNLKTRFAKYKKGIDVAILMDYKAEFCEIVESYLNFAETFSELTKKYPIADHIRKQYNVSFVNEFNTIFRPNFINYLRNLGQKLTQKMEDEKISSAKILE